MKSEFYEDGDYYKPPYLWLKFGEATKYPTCVHQGYLRSIGPGAGVTFVVTGTIGMINDEIVDEDIPGADVYFCVRTCGDFPLKNRINIFVTDGDKYAYPFKPPPDGEHEMEWDWDLVDKKYIDEAIRLYLGSNP